MFDWDDLRVFLAAARAGTLIGAGQRLGIDTATVGRRVARLETSFKSTLLARSSAGLQLTAAGAQLLDIAYEAEATMERALRVTQPEMMAGTVRISASEGFGSEVLAPALPALAAERPGLRIELAAQPGFLSPSRREVDMVITLSAQQGSRVIVEPLTPYQLALYASPSYLDQATLPRVVEDLRKHSIVGYVNDLIYASELRYLDEVLPGLTPILASSSIRAQRAILLAGGGIGVLPCFLSSGLKQVLPQVVIDRRFWLNTHADVHAVTRVRVVRHWLKGLVARQSLQLAPLARSADSALDDR